MHGTTDSGIILTVAPQNNNVPHGTTYPTNALKSHEEPQSVQSVSGPRFGPQIFRIWRISTHLFTTFVEYSFLYMYFSTLSLGYTVLRSDVTPLIFLKIDCLTNFVIHSDLGSTIFIYNIFCCREYWTKCTEIIFICLKGRGLLDDLGMDGNKYCNGP
jgi:hypothetical protein